MKETNKLYMYLGVILILWIVVLCWPFLILWAINTLFPMLSIPYSFSTWIATVIINISTFGGINYTLLKIKEKL